MEKPNIEYILKLARGNDAVKQKLIDTLKDEHKIAILGLEKSYYLAEDHENELLNGKKKLQQEFEDTLTLIQNFVNSL